MAKLLIADDNEDLLELMEIFLQEKGYEIKTVATKKKLFSELKNYQPDLILLDVFLNGEDGREICKQLRENVKNINLNIIIISANPYAMKEFKKFGADGYIEKPFELEDLLTKIEETVN